MFQEFREGLQASCAGPNANDREGGAMCRTGLLLRGYGGRCLSFLVISASSHHQGNALPLNAGVWAMSCSVPGMWRQGRPSGGRDRCINRKLGKGIERSLVSHRPERAIHAPHQCKQCIGKKVALRILYRKMEQAEAAVCSGTGLVTISPGSKRTTVIPSEAARWDRCAPRCPLVVGPT